MVFIVQQSADGQTSTVYAPAEAAAAPFTKVEQEKRSQPSVSSTQTPQPPRSYARQPQQQPPPPRPREWPRAAPANNTGREASDEEKPLSKNPIVNNRMVSCCFGRSLCGAIVLGLAAGILSKQPSMPLLGAAIANLVIGALHLVALGPCLVPKKPLHYQIVLAASSVMWAAAMAVMFAMLSNKEEYIVLSFDNRKRAVISGLGLGIVSALENITIACGCFAASAFMLCLFEWWEIAKHKKAPS